jgi:hypothetical protein
MGVVRREGDWRLEKREDGVYVVSYDREPKVRIVTAERDEQVLDADTLGQVTVRQVTDYDDVTDAFEEYADRDDPRSVGPLGRTRVDPGDDADEGESGDGDPAADDDGPRRRGRSTSSGRRRRPRGDDAETDDDAEDGDADDDEGETDDAERAGPGTAARLAGGLAGTALAFAGGLLAGGAGLAATAGLAGVGLAVVGVVPATWAATR